MKVIDENISPGQGGYAAARQEGHKECSRQVALADQKEDEREDKVKVLLDHQRPHYVQPLGDYVGGSGMGEDSIVVEVKQNREQAVVGGFMGWNLKPVEQPADRHHQIQGWKNADGAAGIEAAQ